MNGKCGNRVAIREEGGGAAEGVGQAGGFGGRELEMGQGVAE